MKFIIATVIFFLVLNLSVFSQKESQLNLIDKDKNNYEQNVFDEEFDEYLDTTNSIRKRYDKIPEKLPDWVFSLGNLNNPARIVGFSDPNMVREDAYKQAILRAKAMYALLNFSSVSNITDDYTNLKESGKYSLYATKFQDFSLSKTEIVYNDSAIMVIDTFYTKYNEGIVLIEINYDVNSNENKNRIVVQGEHLQVFMEKNYKNERIEFFSSG